MQLEVDVVNYYDIFLLSIDLLLKCLLDFLPAQKSLSLQVLRHVETIESGGLVDSVENLADRGGLAFGGRAHE